MKDRPNMTFIDKTNIRMQKYIKEAKIQKRNNDT